MQRGFLCLDCMFVKRFYSNVKSFQQIPGPKPLPLFGNALLFSGIGPYSVSNILDGFADLQKQYGDIVKLKMGNQNQVLVFNPDDIRLIFNHEGKLPQRPTFEALKHYRTVKYQTAGIVPENGENWYRLRQQLQILLKLKAVHGYWAKQQSVANEFSQSLLSKLSGDGIIKDFIHHAFLYSIEAIGVVCYGKRLNCFTSTSKDHLNSTQATEIVKANLDFLKALGESFHNPPWWKLWKTQVYKTIESTQDYMMTVAVDNLTEARQLLSNNKDAFKETEPVLFHLLENEHLSETEKNLLVTEIFQGGIDATGTVLTLMLYELARNPTIQEDVYEELIQSNMRAGHSPPLLRACLKETLRLHPTAAGTSRVLDSDAVLSGYYIPKDTLVIGLNPIICRNQLYFSNPLQFDPKRWIRKSEFIHSYSSLPFGHGSRMCPGRRFAEQEILLGVSEVVLKYRVLPVTLKEISMVLATNLVPSEPIDFQLVPR